MREPGGGGQWGQLAPQLARFGSVAPNFGLSVSFIFIFLFVLHMNLGPSQKIVGQIREVLCFGQGLPLDPERCLTLQLKSSSRVPVLWFKRVIFRGIDNIFLPLEIAKDQELLV